MKLKKFKREILRSVGNLLLFGAINSLCRTLKVSCCNEKVIEQLRGENKRFVLAFWHGSMLMPWYLHRNKKMAALVSMSKDGALLDRILRKWNYSVVRGSSHTGGSIALGIMVDFARNETSVAITPDGPRGPYHKMKPGAVIAAKRAGVPLILMGVGYSSKKELRSWDKFEIPTFFSKVNVIYSDPVYIDGDLSFDETSRIIEECEKKLNMIQQEACSF